MVKGATGAPSWAEFSRLQRQNRELLEFVGEITLKLSMTPKKQLSEGRNKAALARALGISRASLYYVPRMKEKDWRLKVRLEEELQIHPSYGSRRIATALGLCRQRAQEGHAFVWHQAPTAGDGRKWRKSKVSRTYPNLLLAVMPAYANHI